MELLDITDEYNNLTGKIEDREIVHKNGLWHREVAVIIINENNELLLEKRAATKKQDPNKWGLCAGHIEAGDISEKAIVREIKEEIGLDIKIEDLEFVDILKRKTVLNNSEYKYNYNFIYTYFMKTNKKIKDYVIQEEELSQVKYFSLEEIERAVEEKDQNFTFSRKEYIKQIIKFIKTKIKEENL